MKNIDGEILNAIFIATTELQDGKSESGEITIDITNITEDAREKIINEIIKNLNGLK